MKSNLIDRLRGGKLSVSLTVTTLYRQITLLAGYKSKFLSLDVVG